MKVVTQTQMGFLFWSCSLFSWTWGLNKRDKSFFAILFRPLFWNHDGMRSLCLGGANAFPKGNSTESRFTFHVFMFIPTISLNPWWDAFWFFLVVSLNLLFEVVSKRWAPLNKDLFAVLLLGLEARFTFNWKSVPVSRCERLKQYRFFGSYDIHVASSCGKIISKSKILYRLNNLVIGGICEEGSLRTPLICFYHFYPWMQDRANVYSKFRLWLNVKSSSGSLNRR